MKLKIKYRPLFHLPVWGIVFFVLFQISCRKLVEVDAPVTSLNANNVYTNNTTAVAVLTGVYINMSSPSSLSNGTLSAISVYTGASSDELGIYGGTSNGNSTLVQFYSNALTNASNETYWENIYSYLETVNSALEGLSASSSLTPEVKQQLVGEAKFLRAFFNFYLVTLYGDVPLVTSSNYEVNALLPRAPKVQVWRQIISDLTDAKSLLNANFLDPTLENLTDERVRPTKWAATALLARAYLYTSNYDSAAMQATEVINNAGLFSLDTLNGVFLKNSTEAIWQLQPVNIGWNTQDAQVFILPVPAGPTDPGDQNPVYLSSYLLNSFEPGDQRRLNWVDSIVVSGITYYYSYKYKSATSNAPVTEYTMVLRLAELYLIRAEAEAQLNDLSDATSDLNMIRSRAYLPNIASIISSSQASLLVAIQHERQVELFTEWGHRWLDLKRTGTVNSVMGSPGGVCSAKGGIWKSDWQLYPIPLYELQQDANLTQNLGY